MGLPRLRMCLCQWGFDTIWRESAPVPVWPEPCGPCRAPASTWHTAPAVWAACCPRTPQYLCPRCLLCPSSPHVPHSSLVFSLSLPVTVYLLFLRSPLSGAPGLLDSLSIPSAFNQGWDNISEKSGVWVGGELRTVQWDCHVSKDYH